MEKALKEDFVKAIIYLKRVGMTFPSSHDMHMGELILMRKIEMSGTETDECVSVSEIHKNLHISKPAVSQLLNSLEKKGYVSRVMDKSDRRKVTVSITPKGRTIMNEMKEHLDKATDEIISRIGEDDMKQIIKLFNRLADVLDDIKKENT
ncbi:MAG: MarR family winged helix-turn-helix transcriptional regulator [Saccharofermentanales bacterium]